MEDDDFLAAVEADNTSTPVAEEPKPEPPVEEPKPEPAPEPAPAEPKAEEPLELTEVAPGTPKPDPGFVPIAVMLDARDRAKAAEAELERMRAQQQPQAETPDPMADPEGYASFQEERVSRALQNVTLNTSERFARKEHGQETVETAKAWALQRFAADPLYHQQILNDPDPYERVVTDWRREQVFSEVKDPKEFEQFKAWKQAQNALSAQPGGQPSAPNPAPSIPPPSLASAPSAGDILTEPIQGDREIFEEVLPKG